MRCVAFCVVCGVSAWPAVGGVAGRVLSVGGVGPFGGPGPGVRPLSHWCCGIRLWRLGAVKMVARASSVLRCLGACCGGACSLARGRRAVRKSLEYC